MKGLIKLKSHHEVILMVDHHFKLLAIFCKDSPCFRFSTTDITATARENATSENREGASKTRGSPSKDPHGASSF